MDAKAISDYAPISHPHRPSSTTTAVNTRSLVPYPPPNNGHTGPPATPALGFAFLPKDILNGLRHPNRSIDRFRCLLIGYGVLVLRECDTVGRHGLPARSRQLELRLEIGAQT